MQELNLDKMPDSAFAKKEEKDYNVTITECKLVTATTGLYLISSCDLGQNISNL